MCACVEHSPNDYKLVPRNLWMRNDFMYRV